MRPCLMPFCGDRSILAGGCYFPACRRAAINFIQPTSAVPRDGSSFWRLLRGHMPHSLVTHEAGFARPLPAAA